MIDQESYINIHTHRPKENGAISIFNLKPANTIISDTQFISIGIHPWFIHELDINETIHHIENSISKKNILAIGECGLDKLIHVPMPEQEIIFIKQLKIAKENNKPAIIHCVKAFDELIRIKNERKITFPLIIHGFNNKKEIADQLIKNGFYLSLGHSLLSCNSNASKIIKHVPIEKLFFETDDADVSIKAIFEAAANYLQMDQLKLRAQIFKNFKNVFIHE